MTHGRTSSFVSVREEGASRSPLGALPRQPSSHPHFPYLLEAVALFLLSDLRQLLHSFRCRFLHRFLLLPAPSCSLLRQESVVPCVGHSCFCGSEADGDGEPAGCWLRWTCAAQDDFASALRLSWRSCGQSRTHSLPQLALEERWSHQHRPRWDGGRHPRSRGTICTSAPAPNPGSGTWPTLRTRPSCHRRLPHTRTRSPPAPACPPPDAAVGCVA